MSHEAIYQWIYAQSVFTLTRELIRLRTGRPAMSPTMRIPEQMNRLIWLIFAELN